MARYLINATQAALTPADFARRRLCFESDTALADAATVDPQLVFEHVDALNRVGTAMARVVRLAEKSEGGVPLKLQALMDRLETLLQRELPP